MLYFAYGSNMNLQQMARRCPGAVNLGPACLPGWRLAERMFADIERDDAAETWGVLWDITPAHLLALDRYEGVPQLYRRWRVHVTVNDPDTGLPVIHTAMVYAMTRAAKANRNGCPYSPTYRAACSQGARENGLPVNAFGTLTEGRSCAFSDAPSPESAAPSPRGAWPPPPGPLPAKPRRWPFFPS